MPSDDGSPNPFAGKGGGVPPRENRRGQRGFPKRSTPENIENWERDVKCVQMRKQAIDWITIVATLGYNTRSHAMDRYHFVLREYPREDVETMRETELLAIEAKMQQLEPKCQAGDIRAVEVWAKLSEARRKLIGTEAPERKEVTVLTEELVDHETARLLAQLNQYKLQANPPMVIDQPSQPHHAIETARPARHPEEA